MKKIFILVLFGINFARAQYPPTRFEQSNGTQTPPYAEIISWWKSLDAASPYVLMTEKGMSDAGYPLHLVLISADKDFDIASIKRKKKAIILINNGIHPGEPDGIDASMLLARDVISFLQKNEKKNQSGPNPAVRWNDIELPKNVVLAIIPVYNIGGCLNRSVNYRVDQNGPDEFGSRGNSQNLDLNRDMIKCDSKEARSLVEIFHQLDPDVLVDNHVSNGADYQHIMTLLSTQHSKLGGVMSEYLLKEFEPALYTGMKEKGYDLVPYVNVWNDLPENGWQEYWDSPRYVSGFAAQWHTFSFVPETHMLKPYEQRVKSTYTLMQCFIEFTSKNKDRIQQLRDESKKAASIATRFPISWSIDKNSFKEVLFKGYKSGYKTSEVSGLQRLWYDRNSPYEKTVKIYNTFSPKSFIDVPKAYIIPQGWWKVIQLLQLNKVAMRQLKKDTTLKVEVYRIDDYKTSPRQYEMHHLNSDVKVSSREETITFRKGDWYIPMNQPANRFLVETLEPQAEDSYFAWNYFDAILGQKEGYSAYVFEDKAAAYLQDNPEVRRMLEERKTSDSAFAKNGRAQLNFVYEHSPWREPDYLRYPVYRVR